LCNFLTISSPHCANGHANGMCISSDVGEWGLDANIWQAS
jgi:hypothetical protein